MADCDRHEGVAGRSRSAGEPAHAGDAWRLNFADWLQLVSVYLDDQHGTDHAGIAGVFYYAAAYGCSGNGIFKRAVANVARVESWAGSGGRIGFCNRVAADSRCGAPAGADI